MMTHITDATAQSTACALLSTLMTPQDQQDEAAADPRRSEVEDGLDATVHYHSQAAKSASIAPLRNKRRQRVTHAGALSVVLNGMRFHASNNDERKEALLVQTRGCRVLLSLLGAQEDYKTRASFVKQGGINVVEDMLKNNRGDLHVQRKGCKVLRELTSHLDDSSQGNSCLATNRRSQLVMMVMVTMGSHRFDEEVQRICCQTLANLLSRRMGPNDKMITDDSTSTTLSMLSDRGVQKQCFSDALMAMKEFPGNFDVQSHGSRVLSSLLYAGAMRKEQVRPIIKLVLGAMKRSNADTTQDWSMLLQHGCDMLLCLSQVSRNRGFLRKRGAVPVLMGILNGAPTRGWSVPLQRAAGVALFYLAETESFVEQQNSRHLSTIRDCDSSDESDSSDDTFFDDDEMAYNDRAEKLCQIQHDKCEDETETASTTADWIDSSLMAPRGPGNRRSSVASAASTATSFSEYSIKLGGHIRRGSMLGCGDFERSATDLPVLIDLDSFRLASDHMQNTQSSMAA